MKTYQDYLEQVNRESEARMAAMRESLKREERELCGKIGAAFTLFMLAMVVTVTAHFILY